MPQRILADKSRGPATADVMTLLQAIWPDTYTVMMYFYALLSFLLRSFVSLFLPHALFLYFIYFSGLLF
jgi:hypothetical protein